MALLRGRWKTGQKIMDNLDLLTCKLESTEVASPTRTIYTFSIDFSGETGVMEIHVEFGKILKETYLNCGFESNLTLDKDTTLLFLAEHLLKSI